MSKEKIWTIIFMIPWVVLVVLFFIWVNKDGFSISKNVFCVLFTTFSSVLWYAIAWFLTQIFVEEDNSK